jgi:drug/metabolite transporter (DMT)-like permease
MFMVVIQIILNEKKLCCGASLRCAIDAPIDAINSTKLHRPTRDVHETMCAMTKNNLLVGIAAALGAGLLWGLVFVAPLLLPDYSPALLTFGRYLAFGLVTLPIAWWFRAALKQLTKDDWWIASKLSLIGNFIYYLALSAAIQLAGAPLPTLIIGTLPVVIAIASNLLSDGSQRFHWRALTPPLLLIVAGLLCVNADQLQRLATTESATGLSRYLIGAALAWAAVAAWTWYPIHNARWLKQHTQHSSMTWASAQGLVTLPIAAVGFAALIVIAPLSGERFVHAPLGPYPALFVGLMLVMGFAASWVGTLLWNVASKNTPTALTGQLIVFETLAALGYAYIVYQRAPSALEIAGIALLVLGVIVGVRVLSKQRQ